MGIRRRMTSLTNHPRSKALLVMGAVGAGAAYARKRGERLVGRKDVYRVVVNRPTEELEPEPGRFAQPLADIARHARLELHPGQAGRGTSVRAEATEPGVDVRGELRAAKQILETGEELRVDRRIADREPAAQKATDLMDRLLAKGGGR
jgi:hypothetical protein